MSVIFLDAAPLGMITNPKSTEENDECRLWLRSLTAQGVRIIIAEIIDYEVRRELLRANKPSGIVRLDLLRDGLEYLPITTAAMHKAAELWADVRRHGKPTADPHALDGDVILAAQALTSGIDADDLLVATTNVGHLDRLITAKHWRDVSG